jgi:MoxR-like ATPase
MTTAATTDRTVEQRLLRAIQSTVAVPAAALEPLLCALFARGHALIEGIPGIGKTLLARTLARCVDCEFRRIQFTNDLMPSDVIGSSLWRQDAGRMEFVPGPLFANLVLADEINRTSPRTLSCLLEAMENGRASVDGRTLDLGRPFLVLATRNPIEFHGTYPVPEAALDRFLVRVQIGYPEPSAELQLYLGRDAEQLLAAVQPLLTREQLIAAQARVDAVSVREAVAEYCYRVVAATRTADEVVLGASPRAALSWLRAAKARAFLQGRDFVLPDDLKALAVPVLAHRIVLHGGNPAGAMLEQLIASIEVPL